MERWKQAPYIFRNYVIVNHVIASWRCFSFFSIVIFVFPSCFVQLRNKLNQEQNAKLQQQRECLNKRNSEVAVMDKRVNELRDRLWKKKAALQQKENFPVSEWTVWTWAWRGEAASQNPDSCPLEDSAVLSLRKVICSSLPFVLTCVLSFFL